LPRTLPKPRPAPKKLDRPSAPIDNAWATSYILDGTHPRAAFLGAGEGPDVLGPPQGAAPWPPPGVSPREAAYLSQTPWTP